MSTCMSKIRKFLASLPPGEPFSTQSCVQYGSRSAIDQSIALLIKKNVLERLVRGVFVDSDTRKHVYTAEEIAKVKLRAFGNEIVQPGSSCAKERGLQRDLCGGEDSLKDGEGVHEFLTSGHSTRFRFGEGYIYLRKCNGRKIQLSDSRVGKTVRALWFLQQLSITLEIIYKQILTFERNDFVELVGKARLMPAWLRDRIVGAFNMRWQRTVFTQSIRKRELCVIDSC
ncbi:hypothetical protein BH11CYA1_BH11CYA1_25700 [soil metagenome]